MTKRLDSQTIITGNKSPSELPLTNTSYSSVEKVDKDDMENNLRQRNSTYATDATVASL